MPTSVPAAPAACPPNRQKPARTRTKKRVVKLDEQHGIAAARIFMDEIGCLVSPVFESPVCTQCGHVLRGRVTHHLFKKHHVRCSQEDIDAAMALLRPLQPEEPPIDLGAESEPRMPIEGIPILDGVGCPLCQACFTTKGSLWNHIVAEHPDEPEAKQPPRRVKLQKPLRGAGARCVEVIVEESHDASAADVSENEEELEEQQRFKQFISSAQAMASEAEEKRCPHGVHQMHPFYDSVGMTLVINELKPERMVELGHNTPSALLESGMHELFWTAYEQLSDQGLAAAAVTRLFDDNEGQYRHRPMRQVQPQTVSSQRMSMARTASVAEGQAGVDVDIRADGDVTDETLRTIVCRGIELNVEELGAALEQMRKDMTEILDKQLLLDSRLRKDYEKEYERLRLKEDRTNRVKNWWVGHGSPAENVLFDHIGQTPSLRQEFIQTEHGPGGELTFREDRVRTWLLYVCRFNELALTYTHIAGDRKRSIAELTANQEALEARYPISWNPVTDLSPEANGRIIMNTRAEHDVPYMTQLAKQASISWGHSFNSQEQLDLAAAIDQHRPEDGWLIVVAPTGMGKTFCTLPKLGCRPHAGTVLWIVPFVAVANDLLRRLQGAGHSAQRWLGPSTQVADGLDVLIVTTDMFVRVGSESLHGKVCFQHIRTVVMDEAHTLISDASYRDVMDEVAASVGSGGWTNIKRVALTGTLCIGDQEHLFRKLGQQVGGKVYRLETMRRDLQLRVLHGNQLNFLSHVQAIVDTRVMRQANGERVHMMVFCDTVNEVKLLCDQLHAYGYVALPYYTDLEEKAQKDHVAQWQRGECDVIVATSCLSTGVDLLTIRHVLWYGNGYNVYTLAQDTAAVATNAGPMTDAAVPRIQTSDAWIGEADTASMSVPASPMVSDANDEAPLQQEARGPVQTTMAEDESTPQPVMQSAAQPTPTKHAPTPSASIICVPVPSASGSTSSPTRSAASSASGTLRRKRVPLAAESTCTPGSDDHNNVGNSIATSPAPSTSKRTASDVTCTGAASLTAAQAAESRLPAAKRAASSDARTATVAATATTRSEATVSAAATPPNRHNVAPIFRSKSGTKKKYLMNYAAADKFIGVLKLMDDYCMRCTIRQAKPVLKAGHQCVSNRVCERCHFKGHEASKCFVGFAYPDRACCYACGMPKGIRGCKTWDHLCRQSQGLDSGLSCLLLYSDCHSGLRDLSQRMGYNLRERTLKDIKTRDLFVKWLYSSGPCPFPGDGHWRLVEFVFESARVLLPCAAEAQVGPLDSFR
ncbi:uncharacterized protein MONBRDRAFT_13177 [Monosiga brevicollis MX1]|uniref:DNA helicase n=1 Tax=Monosiga brevicollis TaxID=81824 RepID=A9VEI0_MONBE|nr:uncharacterized protein MONBRDRAFT_13177 [Monosiga brevicollis MX1]EDQ84061.1 predicted protein [Monosiga brevicollis MX1]|eukprot:XP_001751127.1 hypothetical protein [Monosiga brevicollis MX1]